MSVPDHLKYAKTHEWARLDDDGLVTVGITRHAQDLLGDMVYVELPEPGKQFSAGQECGVVESVKAASDIYSPLSGTVAEVNVELESSPEKINQDPYAAWIFKLKPADPGELGALMDAAGYRKMVEAEG